MMSKTNQVCICCEARNNCPHYDTRKTVCDNWLEYNYIKSSKISVIPETKPDWQHYRIQAAIAAMQSIADTLGSVDYNKELITKHAVELADALIEELKKGGEE